MYIKKIIFYYYLTGTFTFYKNIYTYNERKQKIYHFSILDLNDLLRFTLLSITCDIDDIIYYC